MNNKEIIKGIQHLSKNDLILAEIIAKAPLCNLSQGKGYYKALLRSIIGQQLSIVVAEAISKRFFSFFDGKPLPEKIITTPDEQLRKLGLSAAKTKYVKDLSEKIISKEVAFRNISKKTDDEIIAILTRVKGIGEWTAHMFLIFTLGRLNVLPVLDLGIKKSVMLNYKMKTMPDNAKIEKLARKKNWSPYCSIACWYLWHSLDNK